MSTSPLCQLPAAAASACGCGASQAAPLILVPLPIDNPPGMSAIPYRVGTFTSFRQAMLDNIATPDLLGTAPNPFVAWKPGTNSDYQTRFIELWAYLADILTFYQERIANEAYIGTATQLDSVLRLSQLIAYQPSPGSASSGVAAFNAAAGKVANLPASFRIGSRAQSGKAAAVFETIAAITVRAEHNAIVLSSVAPTNQFATLSSFKAIFSDAGDLTSLLAAANDIFPGAGSTFITTLPRYNAIINAGLFQETAAVTNLAAHARTAKATPAAAASVAAVPVSQPAAQASTAKPAFKSHLSFAGGVMENIVAVKPENLIATPVSFISGINYILNPVLLGGYQALGDIGIQIPRYIDPTSRPIVLAGINFRLNVGDYVLTIDSSTPPAVVVYQLDSVTVDKPSNTTTITWTEEAGRTYTTPVSVYAMRVKASAFGSNAPAWVSLPPSLNGNEPSGSPPTWPTPPTYSTQQPWPAMATPYPNYDDPNSAEAYLPFLNNSSTVYFDGVYDSIRATAQNPGWLVILPGGELLKAQYFPFTDVSSVTAVGYSFSTKVTRIALQSGSNIPTFTFGIRDTVLLAGAELLPLQPDLPLPDLLEGSAIILAGLFPNLQSGQPVVLQGNLYAAPNSPSAEYHTLQGQPLLDTSNILTTVTLDKPLSSQYSRASSILLANIAAFTQGETVKDEVLGNGNATAYQTFELAKKPLTYLPSTDPESISPVQSTLIVSVNGVEWQEESELLQSGSNAQQFTITNDVTQQSSVIFGDGIHGAVPPTGVQNVHARYRIGLGTSGNVLTGAVAQLIDSVQGLSQVTNPLSTSGGADPDTVPDTRINGPASVRAFNRAVSEADYAALALTFPGISKATASMVTQDSNGNSLAQPYVQLTIATNNDSVAGQSSQDQALVVQLRQFLDQRRDPNIPLRVATFTPVYLDLSLTVDLLSTYPRQATLGVVQSVLNPGVNSDGSFGYFSFQQLNFGQSLYLSAIYALVQNIPGVSDLTITRFQPTNMVAGSATITPSDIAIGPAQIAAIGNDPSNPQYGQLIITPGTGGFADS